MKPTVRPTRTSPTTACGTLENHPANPPYTVTTALDDGRLHVTISNGWRAVGSGVLLFSDQCDC